VDVNRKQPDHENLILLSVVVIWEIRIKQALGKLATAPNFFEVIKNQGFELMSITPNHACGAEYA
jgi:PIN domain nuclease of toxin-antitoxin system